MTFISLYIIIEKFFDFTIKIQVKGQSVEELIVLKEWLIYQDRE